MACSVGGRGYPSPSCRVPQSQSVGTSSPSQGVPQFQSGLGTSVPARRYSCLTGFPPDRTWVSPRKDMGPEVGNGARDQILRYTLSPVTTVKHLLKHYLPPNWFFHWNLDWTIMDRLVWLWSAQLVSDNFGFLFF